MGGLVAAATPMSRRSLGFSFAAGPRRHLYRCCDSNRKRPAPVAEGNWAGLNRVLRSVCLGDATLRYGNARSSKT
jgi:hypothetical protein